MLDAFYWFGMENHENFLKIDPQLMSDEDRSLIMYSILIKIGFTLYFVFVSRQIYDQFRDESILRKISMESQNESSI